MKLQHSASLHAGIELATAHGRVFGLPHESALSRQIVPAYATQTRSHSNSQQVGSRSQTSWQHSRSKQPGVPCGKKQLSAPMSPHPSQMRSARATQSASHVTSQQVGSFKQICPQQNGSLQPGCTWTTKQFPVAALQTALITGFGVSVHRLSAVSTQTKSHSTKQQKSSNAHTASQHVRSSQYGVGWTTRHDERAGWLGLMTTPHRQSGRLHRDPSVARDAQEKSQRDEQQKGSTQHTASQHTASSQ
jgi:hypothetical protein